MAHKDGDSLGDRMKAYESTSKTKLMMRTPVIIRVDGKAFHTFTRGFNKPYDVVLSNAMIRTMSYLCQNIQGCVFGYTQSDEITLVLIDYKTLKTSRWFDYEVQKICSIAASMATLAFNNYFTDESFEFSNKAYPLNDDKTSLEEFAKIYGSALIKDGDYNYEKIDQLYDRYSSAIEKGAMFDARCFNIPKEEVTNCLIWRQQDATRNSIEMLGRAYFSDKQLFKKNCSNIQDMLMLEHGVNWNNIETRFKRGASCFKRLEDANSVNPHMEWFIDFDMPIITQDRNYIEKHIFLENN